LIKCESLNQIREHFSVKNDAAKFARRFGGRFIPARKYTITPAGRFDAGLYKDILQFVTDNNVEDEINYTDTFKQHIKPGYDKHTPLQLNLKLRDYQEDIVNRCLKVGRGTVILATAGGKTLTMASLLESIYQQYDKNDFKAVIMVPDRGLVEQTYSDLEEYGVNFSVSKWTGDDDLDLSTNVVICNLGILQSSKSDTSWVHHVDLCIIDEVHKVRQGNKINKIINKIHTPHRFGFTGTMPEELMDQWNIIGKIGPVLYEKNSAALREENYIAQVKAQIIDLKYETQPKYVLYPSEPLTPTKRYKREIDFIINSDFRNNIISKLSEKFDKNSLILIDYIEHGEILFDCVQRRCKDKKVYFIRGNVAVEDRDKIRQLMETSDDIVIIAISKIFSTGINIKNLHYIVFAGGGKAKIKTIQSIGRGLRLHKTKQQLIILDIGDDLMYGRQHLQKRIEHYDREKICYGRRTIRETKS
jgi:superfamily II DNA or RNA helicase